MNRVLFKTTILTLIMFFISTAAQALDSEYKNSLTKVELTKTNENSYNVNLYTSKKFSEPVKIIKKSDLSYYILLPETKNSTLQTSFNSTDIRNVNTKSYQYAGADINNGYTKIDINTTKPINFNLSIKDTSKTVASPSSSIASNTPKAAAKTIIETETPKVQKKNLDFQKAKNLKKQIISAKPAKKETSTTTVKKQTTVVKTSTIKKTDSNPVKNKVSTPKTPETQTVKPPLEVDKAPEFETAENNQIISDEIEPQKEILSDNSANEDFAKEENLLNQKNTKNYFLLAKNKLVTLKYKTINIKKTISLKLNEYGLNIRDLILMTLAGVISFIVMLLILTRKAPQARLKNKADLFDKNEKPKLTPKKQTEETKKQPNNGQYFIFDKNVRQTGFCDPATSAIKKNYELSSYEPDLRDNYKRAEISPYGDIKENSKYHSESEYDIIQKILKEDSFIEIAQDEITETRKQTEEIKENKTTTSPISKEEIKPQQIQEPTVLSSVEIAPERGFMCVTYNDNINLMGYIFDDVFALHNFKAPKLENYDIKFRLTEKDDKSASFIVKVDKTKMLIKVTKSYMKQEVVM